MESILITGGNGEMAKRIVKYFYKKYDFVLLDLHEVVNPELLPYCPNYFKCNICNLNELKMVQESISKNNIKIISIINNAAIDFVPNVNTSYNNDYSSDVALNVLNVNVVGAINIIEVFKEQIMISKGSIINVSSIYSKVPPDQKIYSDIIGVDGKQFMKPIYYGLSKSALNYVTKYYVRELSKYEVNVNTIIFGGIEANQPESFKIKYANKVPLRRMAKWEDVMNIFNFILLKESNYITGNEFRVDGGFLNFS